MINNNIFDKIDFLVYSSHKTSTQTMIKSLSKSNYKTFHIHHIDNLKLRKNNIDTSKENFIQEVKIYNKKYKKKLKIISLIRNPVDRLISSFFQSYYNDEIRLLNVNENDTTIMKYSINELCKIFLEKLKNKTLPNYYESLYELSDIFQIDIVQNLKLINNNYYYYENDLIQLYVLDFTKINNLKYINNSLNTKILKIVPDNLSVNKKYYPIYSEFRNIMCNNEEYNSIVKDYYKKIDLSFFYYFVI
jgi:hypothetical protein